MCPERQPGDDAEGTAAAPAHGPKQVLVLTGVGDHQAAVGGDQLGLDHAGGAGSVFLGPAAKAAALNEAAGGADRAAPAALDVATVLYRDLLVAPHPPVPSPPPPPR